MRRAILRKWLDRIGSDRRGSVLVEFALLAPVIIALLIGVVQVGLHVQNSNAVRNLASDGARMATVAYQRGNQLTAEQIGIMIRSEGVGGKYNLDTDRLEINVTQPTSRIGGVREMRIQITYDPPNFLSFAGVNALRLSYERPVFLLL